MNDRATRRGFLGRVAATGGCWIAGGLGKTARAAEPAAKRRDPAVSKEAELVGEPSGGVLKAPLVVLTQSLSRDVEARAGCWSYIAEVLHRAGVFYEQIAPADVASRVCQPGAVMVLAGNLQLSPAERDALAAWVKRGGALVGLGGISGLNEVFGVAGTSPLAEGWIKASAREHPLTAGLRSVLHVFGGYAVKPGTATSLAEVETANGRAKGSAVVENRFGKGCAVLVAPDLLFSIVHIQQGLPVFQDGKPAPDGSAPIDDGILKAEDGLVLDWQRDRTPMPPDGVPAFLEPVSDQLRELLLRCLFYAARQQGVALPLLWYWPGSLKAVGHISHDTDGNDPQKALALLETMNRKKVKSTWCTMFPGGYPKSFYHTLQDQGFEIALHYDAHSGGAETSWSKDHLARQHRWLIETAGLRQITSNKNHYTRWEGRLAFYRWCEALGIASDQTRGPSKQGTIGFPLGGSQPYFPLDDEAATPRLMNVLEVNMLTQDLGVICPADYGKPLLDSALRHHGVAHFLFHPAHITNAPVAEALSSLIDYGRARGLEWWTNEQVYRWEMLRRSVTATFEPRNTLAIHAAQPLHNATLLFLRCQASPRSVHIDGRAASASGWSLYGFEFDAVTTDIAGAVHVRVV